MTQPLDDWEYYATYAAAHAQKIARSWDDMNMAASLIRCV